MKKILKASIKPAEEALDNWSKVSLTAMILLMIYIAWRAGAVKLFFRKFVAR